MSVTSAAPSSSRRSVLTAALAGLAAGGTSYGVHAALALPDPVFALIKAEQQAFIAFDAACKASDSVELGREATEAEEAAWAVAGRAQEDALAAVMKGATTPAGLVAAMDLFVLRELENVSSTTDDLLLHLFATIRAHLGVPAPATGEVA